MKKISFKDRLENKAIAIMVLIILLTSSVISYIGYMQSDSMLASTLGKRTVGIAKRAAENIDPAEFQKIKTAEDMSSQEYIKIRDMLEQIRVDQDLKFVYTIRQGSSGEYMYIVDASEDAEDVGALEDEYDEIYSNAFASSNGYTENRIDVTEEYGALVTAYYPIKDKAGKVIGIVGVDSNVESEYAAIKQMGYRMLMLSAIMAALASLIVFVIFRRAIRPITQISETAERIAQYDLTVENVVVSDKGQIGVLADGMNGIVDNMKKLVLTINSTMSNLEEISDKVTMSCTEVNIASNEISRTIEEIASGTVTQAEEASKSASMSNELSSKIDSIQENLEITIDNASQMRSKNEEGRMSVTELEQRFAENKRYSSEVSRNMEMLTESSQSAGKIIDAIKGIAKQTNLLALNASIEAERAGVAGRSFAVVAEEVRNLAVQSALQVEEIEGIIGNMLSTIETTSQAVDSTEKTFEAVDEYIGKTVVSFESINDSAQEVITQVELLGENVEVVSSAKESVIMSVNSMQEIAEESAAATEQISASAQEQSAMTLEILETSKKLNGIVDELSKEIGIFKV
ncbi:methyl-accepting chemotaxis protein TlpA (plasmid) [Peptoclostridium acidaminophilum DSM 3953]|uniref:Methyl-accepting chemotaxis protein TlpA n=1 Tax=Peptoclostridium acidaminophilum DSM 3953 TaxID=1286171 RepID=W8TQA4_PEPAC|nr:methyl-accepting chemotaxis protein [Peptoclostridium acidaminophilum]AHM58272.1 methyl-accepting chemotaxis protein TlpA [Peptoclostridium acidaminophilum DSM 3953]